MTKSHLVKEAQWAYENCRSSYWKSARLGVALNTDKGVVHGATFQTCAYPSTICAVRGAVVSAISKGVKSVDQCVVVNETRTEPWICGCCTDMLFGLFGADVKVYYGDSEDKIHHMKLRGPPQSTNRIQKWTSLVDVKQVEEYKPKAGLKAPEKLCYEAMKACQYSFVPISKFPVGAAIQTEKGIFTGCNVEFEVMSHGLCAERTALAKAVSEGARDIQAIAICCWNMRKEPGVPCGGCRQNIAEMAPLDVHCIIMDLPEPKQFMTKSYTIPEILPDAFTPEALN